MGRRFLSLLAVLLGLLGFAACLAAIGASLLAVLLLAVALAGWLTYDATLLLADLARETDCVSGTGAGLTDPVLRGLAEYRDALNRLTRTASGPS